MVWAEAEFIKPETSIAAESADAYLDPALKGLCFFMIGLLGKSEYFLLQVMVFLLPSRQARFGSQRHWNGIREEQSPVKVSVKSREVQEIRPRIWLFEGEQTSW